MPIRSATTEELPWAMLPNGPVWTSAGVFSIVCIRFGLIASLRITAIAPAVLSSSAVIGSPSVVLPTTIRPSRSRMSRSEVASATIAITSDAAVMSKPLWRMTPVLAHAHADDAVAQRPVVDVQHPPPGDAVAVDVEEVVVVVDVVVDHRRQQVVGGGDGVQVAGQVQVEGLHRDHIAPAASGS